MVNEHDVKIFTAKPDEKKKYFLVFFEKYIYAAFILIAIIITTLIALRSEPGTHPDEALHVDAFTYFETHWWPADLGSEEVFHGPFGRSRIYEGEIAYLIFAKLSPLIRVFIPNKSAAPKNAVDYYTYRMMNVLLLLGTLSVLFFTGSKWHIGKIIGMFMLIVPQVPYLYSYANTDAWSLSVAIFTLLIVLRYTEQPIAVWNWRQFMLLGVFWGLGIAAKVNYYITLALPGMLLLQTMWSALQADGLAFIKKVMPRIVLMVGIALVFYSPFRVVYRLEQGNFTERYEQVQNQYARPGLKPNNPTMPFFRLYEKNVGLGQVLFEMDWFLKSYMSFYGKFGYLTLPSPTWAYLLFVGVYLVGFTFTALDVYHQWGGLSDKKKMVFAMVPTLILLNVVASVYYSWVIDFQAQGRYLFPALIAFGLMTFGYKLVDPAQRKTLFLLSFSILYAASGYNLVFNVLVGGIPRL